MNQDASSAGLSISTTTAGQTLYITASISAAGLGGGTPTGTVTLKINNTSYGTLTLTNGVATFMVTGGLVAGNYTFYLSYSGDGDFFSSSNSLTAVFRADAGNDRAERPACPRRALRVGQGYSRETAEFARAFPASPVRSGPVFP